MNTKKSVFGKVYYHNGHLISLRQVSQIVKVNNEAFHLVKNARFQYVVSDVFGFAGSTVLCGTIYYATEGNGFDWRLGAGAVGLYLLSFHLQFKAFKKSN